MEMDTLRDLYIDELKDLYSAEKQLVRALSKMAKNASDEELKEAFSNHLTETEGHVERLEQIFEGLGASPRGKKCVGMEGLIEEANELLEEDAEEDVIDAGLISKAQHVEHYEMAGYGTVRTYAQMLGEEDAAQLLQQTLDEEKEADRLLSQLAEAINVTAAAEDESEGGEESEEAATPSRGRGNSRTAGQTRRPAKPSRARGDRTAKR